MKECSECGSTHVIKKGPDKNGSIQRYKCMDCGKPFRTSIAINMQDDGGDMQYQKEVISTLESSNNKWVITTAINDSETNNEFLATLKAYCEYNRADLVIIPIKYKTDCDEYVWDEELDDYFVDENCKITKGLSLFAGIHVPPTTANPLTSFEKLTKGGSAIIPHPQIMMKCVAVNHIDKGAILYTTGCISHPNYSGTKAGECANLVHSMSALIVEEDEEIDDFHIRVLNADSVGGFYDLDSYYCKNLIRLVRSVPALVVGDEHVAHIDLEVVDATFSNVDSMVNVLNPKYIVRHDVLDFYASNHHHKHDFFLQYKKHQDGTHIVEDELIDTMEYLVRTTPESSISILVPSNHNDHLTRWLQECNPKYEPWNAKLYHKLMFLKLDSIDSAESCTPFELWYNTEYDSKRVKFINASDSFMIKGSELALHGHYGTNGSRGSATQFSKLGMNTVIGHSHTPMIIGQCFQVGHSCKAKMGYNQGPSSWNNAHCIIHNDGSRQMIFVKKGKWKL